MNKRVYLNDGWEFTERFDERFAAMQPADGIKTVRLPHSCRETPYDYFKESLYQMACGYRRNLDIPEDLRGKVLLLTIEAAGHYAEVFFNGRKVAEHRCGYTAFTVDLSPCAEFGALNPLVIKVDSRETLDQPPFGYVIDYMTYGGLYREVRLDIKEPEYIADVFAKPSLNGSAGHVESEVTLSGIDSEKLKTGTYKIYQTLVPVEVPGALPAASEADVTSGSVTVTMDAARVLPWDVDSPNLFILKTQLLRGSEIIDEHSARIGFRDAEFRADGFYLNGRKLKLRGLNRHQAYPYVGYAMPKSIQENDADILKKELGLNAVRTSHYPQSQYFIDRCDELGLLVFTEIPGWQHIGGDAWQDIAAENVREMVTQYRNHPSVILWGVRINESQDCDGLYERTNRIAHELDPTRPTSGVRYLKKSHLLEDVYAYNDFSHSGANAGCEDKKNVTSDNSKPYLISEFNGHMFPTKMFDSELHRQEHALRHARVLNDALSKDGIAGCFGWCFADYNTHKDFGSGDRICYHGVLDMYRNPKTAAYIYAAQQDKDPVLFVTSQMDIGEHPSGNMGRVYIITNADSVKMYRNELFLHEYRPEDSEYKSLPHGPILITDYIGNRIETGEGFPKDKADLCRDILNYSAVYGFDKLPPKIVAKAAKAMVRYRLGFGDAYKLYGKYISSWGGSSVEYRFEAYKDGKLVKTVTKTAVNELHLECSVSNTVLTERSSYDAAAVRVRICGQNGEQLSFYNGSLRLSTEGPIELIGPDTLQLRGGCGGTYIKTLGSPGNAALILSGDDTGTSRIGFKVVIPGMR
ncbi:MAG: glycoside hydrolase family 2 protein [Firmicutes bacterium]|nr:glycoside hydrolase family 2 protein [Bacillota bacterium]